MEKKTFENGLFERMVGQQIGNYKFKNPLLLQQAFTRKSYSEENGGENNEVLEFIGDKALDIAVVRYLVKRFGNEPVRERRPFEVKYKSDYFNPYIMENFTCELDEGELTKIKQKLVQKDTLALRIDDLGFADFLLMGRGDVINSRNKEKSVKEDLFEAIIGAVALDSNWNFDEIQDVVEILLCPDSFIDNNEEADYVGLIYEWAYSKTDDVPLFKYFEETFGLWVTTHQTMPNCVYQNVSGNCNWIKYHCHLKILDDLPEFVGYGSSKNDSRKAVCRVAYEYLEEHDLLFSIKDEIENPNYDESINQLEILARRGYFSIPKYDYQETHDEDGNPVWNVKCSIEGMKNSFEAVGTSKKHTKKDAAFQMLSYLLDLE